jgi:hypothetical protein
MLQPPAFFCRVRFGRQITQIAASPHIAHLVQVIWAGHSRFGIPTSPSPPEGVWRPEPSSSAHGHGVSGIWRPSNSAPPQPLKHPRRLREGGAWGVTRPSDSSPRGRGHRGPTRRPNPRPPCGRCLGRPPPFHRALPPLAGLCAGRLFRAASGCCLALGSVVFARNVKVQTGPRRDVGSRELFDGRKEKVYNYT